MKIITPLKPKDYDEFISLLDRVDERADIIEIWLDGIPELDEFLDQFETNKDNYDYQYIGVCKSISEKGIFEGDIAEKNHMLHQFLRAGGDWVDVDVTQSPYEMIAALPPDRLWLSFHDFKGVSDELEITLDGMKMMEPYGYKFAVTTDTLVDMTKFLYFVEQTSDIRVIYTTMGEHGVEGRQKIGGHSWGQFFALDSDTATASGQMTLSDL